MVDIQLNDIYHCPEYLSLCPHTRDRETGLPQSSAKYIHSHLRKCPNSHTLGIHHREAAILFPMLQLQCIHLLDDLDPQSPIESELHPVRRYAIFQRYAREFQLSSRLLTIYISKLSYSLLISSNAAVTSSIAAAASSMAAKALSA